MTTDTHHPIFARLYAWAAARAEPELAPYRGRLLAELSGAVCEIGPGPGGTLAYYPEAVNRVIAVEPEPSMRARAETAAESAPVPVDIRPGTAVELPLSDGSVDAVVCSLVLCSVPDLDAALAEARRVVRSGGELRLLEHVVSPTWAMRNLQRALQATVWPRLAGGCHPARDPVSAAARVGFSVRAVERFRFPDVPLPIPTAPNVVVHADA